MRLLSPTCGSHLHCHSEVAGFGVPDNAGVHGWLDAPAPLQVAHRVLVQVAGQDRGEAGADPAGGELQGTVCGDETREMRKNLSVKKHRLPACPGILLSSQSPFCKKHGVWGFQGKVKATQTALREQAVSWFIVCAWCCPGTQLSPSCPVQITSWSLQNSTLGYWHREALLFNNHWASALKISAKALSGEQESCTSSEEWQIH